MYIYIDTYIDTKKILALSYYFSGIIL